jgi:hypothetical protein
VDIELYERTLLDKRCSGFLASVALARIGGLGPRGCRAVRATLESVAIGLQICDDVDDWEADLARGGAWAFCLMRGTYAPPPHSGKHSRRRGAQAEVPESGVLERMLLRARLHLRSARRRAAALGAKRLAAWAATQEARVAARLSGEANGDSVARAALGRGPAA